MKKNLLYLAVLLGLAFATYWFVFREDDQSFSKREANFTIKDTSLVTAIFLSDKVGGIVKLERSESEWQLNDSMTAMSDAVNFLLAGLSEQRADQPVPSGFHDAAIQELSSNGTKVEIYQKGKKTHVFYVAKNAGYGNVTYMLTEGATRPYIVKIPVRGNMFLGVRYMTRVNDWRERRMMYSTSPIESVRVIYKDSTHYSFNINNAQSNPEVSGQALQDKPLNTKRVTTYLNGLNTIYCTGFEDRYLGKDSIIQFGLQLGTIELNRKGQPAQTLTVYFKPIDKGTKGLVKMNGKEFDYDSFLGLWNQRDFVLLSRKTTEKMFRAFPEFFEQDIQTNINTVGNEN